MYHSFEAKLTCKACGDGITLDEFIVHQQDGRYDVYHVKCIESVVTELSAGEIDTEAWLEDRLQQLIEDAAKQGIGRDGVLAMTRVLTADPAPGYSGCEVCGATAYPKYGHFLCPEHATLSDARRIEDTND